MKFPTIFLILTLLISSAGCYSIGSGNAIEEKFDFKDFDKVEAYNGFLVEVKQGDTFSIVVTMDDNIEKYLEVSKKGDTLILNIIPSKNSKNIKNLKADITMPKLTSLTLGAGANANVSGSGEEIYIEVNDGCFADLSAFEVKVANANANNGSKITIYATDSLTAEANNGSSIYYLGNPKDLHIDDTNGSKITPKDD